MQSPFFLAAAAALLVTGCASSPTAEQQAAMVDDARKASGTLVQKLGGELKAALSEQGPDGAIGVCKTRAPQIAADVSKQFGVTAKRVSPKNRNPAGVPDAWRPRRRLVWKNVWRPVKSPKPWKPGRSCPPRTASSSVTPRPCRCSRCASPAMAHPRRYPKA